MRNDRITQPVINDLFGEYFHSDIYLQCDNLIGAGINFDTITLFDELDLIFRGLLNSYVSRLEEGTMNQSEYFIKTYTILNKRCLLYTIGNHPDILSIQKDFFKFKLEMQWDINMNKLIIKSEECCSYHSKFHEWECTYYELMDIIDDIPNSCQNKTNRGCYIEFY